jgi:anti-sigma28 factor (negative regulator of flagellin synthesis)
MQIYNNSQINDPALAQPLGIAPAERDQKPSKIPGDRYDAGHGDQVQLSGLAKQLAASNTSKIDQLKSAIDAGIYTISPSNIAKSIISQSLGN